MPGTLLVNKIGAATGTEISFETGHSMAFTTAQFKLTGGTAGQAITTDGSGNLTFADMTSDPTMGGDLSGTASNAQIVAGAVGATEIASTIDLSSKTVTLPAASVTAHVTPANVSDTANTSTGYFDIPAGTTAQRPGSPGTGNFRINTEIGQLEHYIDNTWVGFGASVPTISGISPATAGETGTSITITGTNFQTGAVVQLIGTDGVSVNAASTTVNSVTEIVFTTPILLVAKEPYDVKVTNTNGGSATLDNVLDAGGSPSWTTAAGNLGSIGDSDTGTHFTLAATDPDGTAVTFAETTSVLTTAGLSLASNGAITGDPTDVVNATTYNFDVDASDGVNTTSRSFSIIVGHNGFANATGGTITTSGGYKYHAFLTTDIFNTNGGTGDVDILVVGGGGSGSIDHGGGGGGGGIAYVTGYTLAAGTYTATVGTGGPHGYGGHSSGYQSGSTGRAFNVSQSGANSTFGSLLTGYGGGGAGGYSTGTGGAGGSGGGCGADSGGASGASQGSIPGGATGGVMGTSGGQYATSAKYGGGGGGAAGPGGVTHTGLGGDGARPVTWADAWGTNTNNDATNGGFFGGGGAAGGHSGDSANDNVYGGYGGGGGFGTLRGNCSTSQDTGQDGMANTGGGGSGITNTVSGGDSQPGQSGDGGTGIVLVRYVHYGN